MATSQNTSTLLRFITTDLTPDSVPEEVWLRIEDLFLDWLASALASKKSHPVPTFTSMAAQMGPKDGTAQVLPTGATSSPYWAAWVNAAASHTLEQDDLHNSSVMHPATVIFPALLAAAQDTHASGRQLLLAAIAGYEGGIRIAEALGPKHYATFHTTATAGTLAAALAVGKLLSLAQPQLSSALGSAGTQTAGLWAFMRGGERSGDSKQLHCAHAAANGLLSAYAAHEGLGAAGDVLECGVGVLEGLGKGAGDAGQLVDGLGSRWAVLETSFKFHACCRHTHPAADALLAVLKQEGVREPLKEVRRVVARVHQGAVDVLGSVDAAGLPKTVHAAKFSMKTVLALIALRGGASLLDFESAALTDRDVLAFRERVSMVLDAEVDAAYPKRWLGRVDVELVDGRVVEGVCDEPKGDPGNTLTRVELGDKFRRLVVYGGGSVEEADGLVGWCWGLRGSKSCVLPGVENGAANGA